MQYLYSSNRKQELQLTETEEHYQIPNVYVVVLLHLILAKSDLQPIDCASPNCDTDHQKLSVLSLNENFLKVFHHIYNRNCKLTTKVFFTYHVHKNKLQEVDPHEGSVNLDLVIIHHWIQVDGCAKFEAIPS